jgi:thiol:disulfide interchange protein/DsbC/DsbD-like thiol-disulfide interchange protein
MRWILGLLLVLANSAAWAQPRAHTKATLYLSDSAAKPGSTVTAALHLKMDQGWHTYWKNPGESGKGTKIAWELPKGVTAGEIQWPIPEKLNSEGLYTYIFQNETALIIPLNIAADAPAGAITIKAKANWLECEKSCIPGSGRVEAKLTIGSDSKPSPDAARIKEWQAKIPRADGDLALTARWDGPATGETRAIVFTLNKPTGAWDFYNYPVEDVDISGKTETLPAADGKVSFRKTAKKFGNGWPKELSGVALIPNDEKNARIVTVTLGDTNAASAATGPVSVSAGTSKTETPKLSSSASEPPATGTETAAPLEQSKTPRLPYILTLAFIGGLILNIMPCVLPVIALKILGFVRQANEEPRRIRQLGLIYALGVIVSLLGFAVIVIGIKQAGRAASWGMQFQNPQFLVFITILVTLVALNLFGVFEINLGGRALDAAGGLASREGAPGAFFNGVLATILATPCTAPFLGTALGFAFTASTPIIILTFVMIGAGLACPYVVLCWHPAWLKRLPKPGPWMQHFKIAMGFPMLATAFWLFALTIKHFGRYAPFYLGVLLVMLAFAAWVFGEFVQRGSRRRFLSGSIAAFVAAVGVFLFIANANRGDEGWRPWSVAAVEATRAKGQIVLVDFTADWCPTCHVNKRTSIDIRPVQEKIKQLNVATFIADNTGEDPAIITELAKYKRAGVPLVVVFPADPKGAPIVLPEVLTPSLMLNALDKAAGNRPVATVAK